MPAPRRQFQETSGGGVKAATDFLSQFFKQEAQNRYNQGSAAIAEAQARMQEIEDLRASPDFTPTPGDMAALNEQYAYWDRIARSSPHEARNLYYSSEAPAANLTREVERERRTRMGPPTRPDATPGGAGPQALGTGAQAPQAFTETVTEEEEYAAPAGQFLSRLQRETARQAREAEVAQEGALEQVRTQAQVEGELTLMDAARQYDMSELAMRQAFEREQQARDRETRFDLERFAQENDIELATLQAALQDTNARKAWLRDEITSSRNVDREKEILRLQNQLGLTSAQAEAQLNDWLAERAHGRALTLQETSQAWDSLTSAATTYAEGGAGANVAQSRLESIAEDESMPERIRNSARAVLQGDNTAERNAYIAQLEAEVAEAEAREDIAPIEVEARKAQLDLLRKDITIADQQIDMTDIRIDREELLRRRDQFDQKVAEWAFEQDKRTAAHDYVEEAITLGMTERLAALREARSDPTHQLHDLAQELSEDELNEAMVTAGQVKKLGDREREAALAEADRAMLQDLRGEATDVASVVEALSGTYSPEELDRMTQEGGRLYGLIDRGLLSPADVEAMKDRSTFFRALEANEVNGPEIQAINERLDQYANPDAFPDMEDPEAVASMEAGLRASLRRLAQLGQISEDEIPGLIDAYKAAWRNQDQAFRRELAESKARTAQLRSQTAVNDARVASEGADSEPRLSPEYVNAYENAVSSTIDAIMEEARLEGCLVAGETGRAIRDNDACENYQLRVRLELDKLVDLGNEMLGMSSPLTGGTAGTAEDPAMDIEPGDSRILGMIGMLTRRESAGSATAQEIALRDRLVDNYPGGEAAVRRDLNLPPIEEEQEPEAEGPEAGSGGFAGGVGRAASGVAGAAAGMGQGLADFIIGDLLNQDVSSRRYGPRAAPRRGGGSGAGSGAGPGNVGSRGTLGAASGDRSTNERVGFFSQRAQPQGPQGGRSRGR